MVIYVPCQTLTTVQSTSSSLRTVGSLRECHTCSFSSFPYLHIKSQKKTSLLASIAYALVLMKLIVIPQTFGEYSAQIEHTLTDGITIVCDRYAFSGVAFSASKGLPFEWCRTPDIGLPAPDLTLFLDISPEKAKERGGFGAERYEKEEMQRNVRKIFATFAEEARERRELAWTTIDAGQTIDVVEQNIWKAVEPLLEDKAVSPVPRLWTSHSHEA